MIVRAKRKPRIAPAMIPDFCPLVRLGAAVGLAVAVTIEEELGL